MDRVVLVSVAVDFANCIRTTIGFVTLFTIIFHYMKNKKIIFGGAFLAVVALFVGAYFMRTDTYAASPYQPIYPTVYAKCASITDAYPTDCEALLDI